MMFMVVSSIISMGIGTFIFELAMIKDMKGSLIELHDYATTTGKNRCQAVKQISAFIEFNLLVKKLSDEKKWKLY